MKVLSRHTVAAAVLLASASLALAQTTVIQRSDGTIEFSPAQRTIIYRHIARERAVALPPQVELRVGAPLPRSVELYSFPDEVYVEVPTLRRYRYVYLNNEIVLVDPDTSEIVQIIRE